MSLNHPATSSEASPHKQGSPLPSVDINATLDKASYVAKLEKLIEKSLISGKYLGVKDALCSFYQCPKQDPLVNAILDQRLEPIFQEYPQLDMTVADFQSFLGHSEGLISGTLAVFLQKIPGFQNEIDLQEILKKFPNYSGQLSNGWEGYHSSHGLETGWGAVLDSQNTAYCILQGDSLDFRLCTPEEILYLRLLEGDHRTADGLGDLAQFSDGQLVTVSASLQPQPIERITPQKALSMIRIGGLSESILLHAKCKYTKDPFRRA